MSYYIWQEFIASELAKKERNRRVRYVKNKTAITDIRLESILYFFLHKKNSPNYDHLLTDGAEPFLRSSQL
jgi:hypothetical protein